MDNNQYSYQRLEPPNYHPQTKFAKVMFLHQSVSHSVHRGGGGGCLPQCRGRHPPPRSSACWEIRATSGRYESYWNAYFLSCVFQMNFDLGTGYLAGSIWHLCVNCGYKSGPLFFVNVSQVLSWRPLKLEKSDIRTEIQGASNKQKRSIHLAKSCLLGLSSSLYSLEQ